uniref:Uncharacterized protein n=1 Tax=Timema bartmani TaxID=61472 RepID=A0A7R9I3X1_9NEOP|nr:unnamed protein product [Timema bartmani]
MKGSIDDDDILRLCPALQQNVPSEFWRAKGPSPIKMKKIDVLPLLKRKKNGIVSTEENVSNEPQK